MSEVVIWDPIEKFLLTIAIVLGIIIGLLWINKGKSSKKKEEKLICYAFGIFFIFSAFNSLFRYFSDFLINGTYQGFNFIGEFENFSLEFELIRKFAYISVGIATTTCILIIEYVVHRTKYLLSFLNILMLILLIVSPTLSIAEYYNLYFGVVGSTFIVILLVYLINLSKLQFKWAIFIQLISFLIASFGTLLSIYQIKELMILPLYVYPTIMIFGLSIALYYLLVYSTEKFTKFIEKSTVNILLILSVTSIGVITIIFFDISDVKISEKLISTVWLIFLIFCGWYSYNLIKKSEISKREDWQEIGALFVRNTNLTGEDLSQVAELQHLYVILKNGITIYSKSLKKSEFKHEDDKDMFLGSAITAIETFLKEMYQSDTVLKEVKQEDVSILIEEGKYVRIAIVASHDQKLLRKKMQTFLGEFEIDYETILKENITDTRLFEPVSDLVYKIFI